MRAALHGRVLLLDGIEKAERNVLPVLNNLLENREMNLDDGRRLVPHTIYDQLVRVLMYRNFDIRYLLSYLIYDNINIMMYIIIISSPRDSGCRPSQKKRHRVTSVL